ncbi:GGDEF domain-containing phosphodiesterase [Lachnoclostridium sp.]|uniref:putative bifunctional diguanylate cyclase/phosphodiesterase n=1 Tax=Lachnoclostridium sp. TaxID=2028282 RepID=UPI00289F8582|nr:GGDEF domain-containing phosphodiesterase [Lachnoclostridium sp.]
MDGNKIYGRKVSIIMSFAKGIKTPSSPMLTEVGKEELYLYSLKKMAEQNAAISRYNLTGLYGNNAFLYKGNECLRTHKDKKYAMIRMDLYRFKTVNEFCGRSQGDALLKHIADCFRVYESEYSVVGHLRADIFTLCTPYQEMEDLIKIVTSLAEKITSFPISCKLLPAFGICISEYGTDVSLLSDYANLALQTIKGKVFSFYSFYDNDLRKSLMLEKKIENEITTALKEKQLEVHIQPKVNMKTGQIIGGEALVRWKHPVDGYLYPNLYIPVLEKSGYIVDVDIYVWTEVFQFLQKLIESGVTPLPISLNVSRLHEYQKDFVEVLCRLSREYKIPPNLITLEITESALAEDSAFLFQCMGKLQEKGFSFSMDDFGSGYSSMNMLKDEPLDEVKIDRLFLRNLGSSKSRTVIRHIISMLAELGLDMIAEGVETKEQEQFLLECGCYKAQGYLYYKPMPLSDFEKLL